MARWRTSTRRLVPTGQAEACGGGVARMTVQYIPFSMPPADNPHWPLARWTSSSVEVYIQYLAPIPQLHPKPGAGSS